MNNEEKIVQKLIQHDQRFDSMDQRFDSVDKRLDSMDQRFDSVDRRLDSMDRRFDKSESDFTEFKHQTLSIQDEMLTILRRLDEERVFTSAWIQRIEKEVEEHTKEIARIKEVLRVK